MIDLTTKQEIDALEKKAKDKKDEADKTAK
mgnify:CR=1 FL=1